MLTPTSTGARAASPVRLLRRVSTVSSLEDGAFTVVLPVLAQKSAGDMGVVAVFIALTAPWALTSLPLGYLADHVSRTRLAKGAAFGRLGFAVFLAALPLWTGSAQWLFPAVAFGLGTCGVASEIARQSLVPQLVSGPEDLVSANVEITKVSQLYGAFVGPLLAGALLTWNQALTTTVLAVLAALTLLFTLLLPAVPPLRDEPMRPRTMVKDGLGGFRYIWRTRTLLALAASSCLVSAIWYVWETTFAAYALADDGLGVSELGYSLLLLSGAAGGFVGARLVQRMLSAFPLRGALTLSLVGWTVWFAVPAFTTNLLAVAGSLVVGGCSGLLWNTISISVRQLVTSVEILGRTTAAYRVVTRTGRVVGAALAGVLMPHMPWQHILAACAGAIALTAVALRFLHRDGDDGDRTSAGAGAGTGDDGAGASAKEGA
ncbi:MFS transporter [Streptomyces gardneri]|uniref:MFS transporter n=1 Tax=Streptomyces gardneri TaxID=66892 RepID=A0A4Y3RYF0_9ACTN|nr:MFS transporter [Streptomyces gardneri]GEB61803.1 MFS transporter [Streptomyces gardneri]GHG93551.1 MFS transporter [Streptomyces gardneri]